MPKKKIDFAAIRKIALEAPGVVESTSWGSPSLKIRGKMFVCIPTHKSVEPDSLVVCMEFDRRAELLENAPDTYYLKPHYENYPCILVRLNRVTEDALRDLLKGAMRFVSAKK